MRNLLSVFAIFLPFLVLPGVAAACSCGIRPNVVQEFAESKTVGVFKLQSVEAKVEGSIGYRESFSVERVFKGNIKVGQHLTFLDGVVCDFNFQPEHIGTEYLFYMDDDGSDGIWHLSFCSRSQRAKFGADDIYYLERQAQLRGKTRISGVLYQENDSALRDVPSSRDLLDGRTVRILGKGKDIKLKTDKNGVYETYGLPPGKYTIWPERIAGFRPYQVDEKTHTETVELKAKSHAEADFTYQIDSVISGSVIDPDGIPMDDVELELVPLGGEKGDDIYSFNKETYDRGSFKFSEIPAGSYILAVNPRGKVSSAMPFGTFYYPGKTSREEAGVITITPGVRMEGLVIKPPGPIDTVTIAGVMLHEDGTPVVDQWVRYFEDKDMDARKERYFEPEAGIKTDGNGKFSLRVLKGQKGVIVGLFIDTWFDYRRNSDPTCKKLDALLYTKKSGENLETQEIFIDASTDQLGHELRFSFPSCKSRQYKARLLRP